LTRHERREALIIQLEGHLIPIIGVIEERVLELFPPRIDGIKTVHPHGPEHTGGELHLGFALIHRQLVGGLARPLRVRVVAVIPVAIAIDKQLCWLIFWLIQNETPALVA
jgi:hypothetical protein